MDRNEIVLYYMNTATGEIHDEMRIGNSDALEFMIDIKVTRWGIWCLMAINEDTNVVLNGKVREIFDLKKAESTVVLGLFTLDLVSVQIERFDYQNKYKYPMQPLQILIRSEEQIGSNPDNLPETGRPIIYFTSHLNMTENAGLYLLSLSQPDAFYTKATVGNYICPETQITFKDSDGAEVRERSKCNWCNTYNISICFACDTDISPLMQRH